MAETLEKREFSDEWLRRAYEAYSKSTSYVDNNYRKRWENNIRRFQSRHHLGSKYNKDAYKFRSRIFRPKTRAAERSNEAAAVAAFFANQEVVRVEAMNPLDKSQEAAAAFKQALVEYRLNQEEIPWFLTCIGAFQDAQVSGVVCSIQDWKYKTKTETRKIQAEDPETGAPVEATENVQVPVKDHPFIELFPVENIRIDPNAKWYDPINSSPYVILLHPMYVKDIKAKMKTNGNGNGEDGQAKEPEWKHHDEQTIKAAREHKWDSTRITREQDREDRTTVEYSDELGEFDIVWVHQNFMDIDGEDQVYWTLGTEARLTDPKPIAEVYWHGKRPIVMGLAVIETHKIYPTSSTELGDAVQRELNEIANQRLDNVKFVLNKRWFVKRGQQVDLRSITKNVPGGVTMVNSNKSGDPDVYAQDFNDVTSSSYQEQDRLNIDYDELVGAFSTSSVGSNRKLNETVGGMAMMKSSVNVLVEYIIRTFGETWVEPTIRQMVDLEENYETDQQVMIYAAQQAKLGQKYGIQTIDQLFELLKIPVKVTVNITMGATDPIMKMQNLAQGLQIILQILTTGSQLPNQPLEINEIVKEVFGFLGYKDGARFLTEELGQDPEKMQLQQVVQQMQQMIQQLQQQIESKNQEQQVKIALGQMKEQGSAQRSQEKEQGEDRRAAAKIRGDILMKRIDLANPVVGEKSPVAST